MTMSIWAEQSTHDDLRAELRRVSTSPLAAVGGTGWETGVALAADLLVAVVF